MIPGCRRPRYLGLRYPDGTGLTDINKLSLREIADNIMQVAAPASEFTRAVGSVQDWAASSAMPFRDVPVERLVLKGRRRSGASLQRPADIDRR